MRALKFLVGVMGVLIVVGTTALVVIIGKRIAAPAAPPGPAITASLAEPPGTEIAAISATPDRTVLLLKGGGPDRVVALDPRSGAVLGTVRLNH